MVTTWQAVLIGFVSAFFVEGACELLDKMHVDDPVSDCRARQFLNWQTTTTGGLDSGDRKSTRLNSSHT